MIEKAKILAADDNPVLSRVVSYNLKNAGFDVVVVSDGEAAWQQLVEGSFDLLVTDHQMPRLTGGELCARMQTDPRLSQVPVIMLTAKGFELDTEFLAEKLGVRAVLPKPFSPSALNQLVREILATSLAR